MQVKVVIGTIAFMLTMIILGFAALREPTRLQEFSEAFEGRSIETGAKLFANNCATCHGVNGRAEECYDAGGNSIGCQGFPLNYSGLLCGDKPQRMVTLSWNGSKEAFIEQTIASGRLGTVMPTWSSEFGGPMRGDQIENLSAFVLNWESEELCAVPVVTYDWPESVDDFLAEFEGDPAQGEEVFLRGAYVCASCHGNPDGSVPAAVGPNLSQIGTTAATRIDGYSAPQYIYESVLHPNAYVVEQCPNNPCAPNVMPQDFAVRMSANSQDLADIISYLLQFNGE